MREPVILLLVLVMAACLVVTGCVGSSANSPAVPVVTNAIVPAPEPETPVPALTGTPGEVVTVVRYTSPPRHVKDSYLLFALQVPAEWNVSTLRMTNSETSVYRTDLVGGEVFSIFHYPITRSREQEYRDRFRQWVPAPAESPETINGIRYDRYESSAGGNTTVAYLVRTTSANERGYGSVLVYTVRDENRFGREDFEAAVRSFRYLGMASAGSSGGDEIPVYDLSGKAVSRRVSSQLSNSSDWDTAGGDFSESEYSAPADSESSGGGCNP